MAARASLKNGALPACRVAYRDHVIELLPGKLVDRLRPLQRDVDPDLAHHGDRFRPDVRGRHAGAERLHAIAEVVADQPLGQLAARAVRSAQDEDAAFHRVEETGFETESDLKPGFISGF